VVLFLSGCKESYLSRCRSSTKEYAREALPEAGRSEDLGEVRTCAEIEILEGVRE
jgi:hypothetical protein